MRTFIVSTFLLILLAGVGINPSYAQKKQKLYTTKVYTVNNKKFQGILESVTDKGLYLKRTRDSSIFISALQIRQIKLRRKGKTSVGSTIGFLTGVALGTGAVIALQNNDNLENTIRIVGATIFTFTTTAIGGAISSRPDEVININGRSEDFLQVLQHLKSMSIQSGN